jgi:hypothetical protein
MLKIKKKTSLSELLMGVGVGLGYLTTLRFSNFIGPSEILIALAIIYLLITNKHKLFSFTFNAPGLVKIYLILAFTLISWFTTFFTANFTTLVTSPQYLISFAMGVLLLFLLNDALREGFNLKRFTIIFSLTFISANIFSYFFLQTMYGDSRYTGGANNPNQLIFYSSSLILLLVLYKSSFSIFAIPIIIFLSSKSNSDTFSLFLAVILISYIFMILFFTNKFNYSIKIYSAFFFVTLLVSVILIEFEDEIVALWYLADGGGNSESTRFNLLTNGIEATLKSPIFGMGVGSFSGPTEALEGWEAHNTFVDFSMQFGVIVPVIFYYLFIKAFLLKIRAEYYLQAACILGFIVSSLFHFTGRHFYFWVVLAIFYNFVFYSNNFQKNKYS